LFRIAALNPQARNASGQNEAVIVACNRSADPLQQWRLTFETFFKRRTRPAPLDPGKPDDSQLYIDFSAVRGEQIITEIKDLISFYEPENPTCTLFTGHIGCGKSTELLKLRQELEAERFHVVYFESSEDLEMADVDIGDVLLAIARRISQSLEGLKLGEAKGLRGLLQGAAKILMTEIELEGSAEIMGVGVAGNTEGELSLSAGIGKITARAKNDATLRDRLNQFLGPQKNQLLEAINDELLKPAIAQLQAQGQQGLVVIVDNLDRIDNRPKGMGRSQQEYLFIDQHECLRKLHCHKVYTMPLALKFSSEYGLLTARYMDDPKVLPMVPVTLRAMATSVKRGWRDCGRWCWLGPCPHGQRRSGWPAFLNCLTRWNPWIASAPSAVAMCGICCGC
jgi:hypothetical protein